MDSWGRMVLYFICLLAVAGLAGCTGGVDIDQDGLNHSVENQHGLNPWKPDTDGDGLNDSVEVADDRLNGSLVDTDGDGLNDSRELALQTNPANPDTDGDGASDATELKWNSNPLAKHSDDDGVPDGVEIENLALPTKEDTDGDGLPDPVEIRNNLTKPNRADTDFDGLSDPRELNGSTSPRLSDTDGDGLNDSIEVAGKTNATVADTDHDGLSDSIEAPPGTTTRFDPTKPDTDEDGLNDSLEYQLGTNPASNDTDQDGRSDYTEYTAAGLDPTKSEVRTLNSLPGDAKTRNELHAQALHSVTFLAALPQNRTKWNRTITDTAVSLCNSHDQVISQSGVDVTSNSSTLYRNTYRVQHAATTMQALGATIDTQALRTRMQTARQYSGILADYTPIIGSYERLHNASCAVKRGTPGAKEDFYIASAEFTTDVTLAQYGVIYKASFKTTGMAARAIGLNRLARVCSYKCVGLIQSELHWALRGAYSSTLDTIAIRATNDASLPTWNETTRQAAAEYITTHTNATLVGNTLIDEDRVLNCVTDNIDSSDIVTIASGLSAESTRTLTTIIDTHKLPKNTNLSFLQELDGVQHCLDTPSQQPAPQQALSRLATAPRHIRAPSQSRG